MGNEADTTLDDVVESVIAPNAVTVDDTGAFPEDNITALGKAGILGLISARELGGGGAGMRAAADVVTKLAGACGSTAMITLMHYAATAAVEAHGPDDVRRDIADGRHLSTLAFSEAGSRSHFWAPTSSASPDGDTVVLDADKSWVTSAGHVASYVWSSRPLAADGPMTLWLVPADTDGLAVAGPFDGLGLRGNGSLPMTARSVRVPNTAMLATDGGGLDAALAVVLPWFLVLNTAFCLGLAQAAADDTRAHLVGTTLRHTGRALRDNPVSRLEFARLTLAVDGLRAFLSDTLTALETGRADATLRVLESKALAAETAATVTDSAMRLCGGAAFRKELGLERRFRDSRAARVMAPTTDALLDFVGRINTGLPLLDEANL
jgi:alkylation response protein AidB-like acyl-CoA dehydrogenase